ncbi:tRNA (adenosine(37)-N6)-threonylcarbamoyltransferase complex ATPase subunit type 1 TsaE [Halomonas sp. MCCC 1A17488]|uniref:tRNA threonylcarbamoyladenosine biosynthesis protein TsaE n=1 Tax=Billgrantia sulfidoxydans TaxID=2733484 RepID=A0ABX7WDG7_9GAMM|nr:MULTISPECIES: tRNA (adenosine(37)-N6)-threonylcarbamoyltransferase complex ATPase subunit type 1 TsaE [Halomonas]MCE8018224.1 tRNA (adenosine(37)-N6)-threonylcarbamoyltransferase complex ATPase subunit type 1 TsaE [Halomonas sp. MCCC 1A17488]MCG3241557.1 tRNA (adenosine(37)-N6)-threonylcarbamoyltransferase complex ATPase subunit type 1 TsaE [Halomonas sp. MCCC 1A17488]QPP51656.1 tRNA (adenosine(37)-N6)-threonylcarbamoyltransferase complex ATPase subunit type 1 TsaE [Halomonas sp. SS10-MC5]QT
MRIRLDDEERQVVFGQCLGTALKGRGRVYLEGELGAGKTTLTRGILRAHGHAGAVKSPTYTLLEPYELKGGRVYHFDLYRLGDPEELEFIGGRDLFADDALCIVEWPSRGEGWLPMPDLHVALSLCDSGREARLEAYTEHGRSALEALAREAALADTISNGERETP